MSKSRTISENQRIIIERVRKELIHEDTIALGAGLPQRLRTVLPRETVIRTLDEDGQQSPSVKVIVVEADEVSASGDVVVAGHDSLQLLNGRRVIVATPHNHPDGEPKLLTECRSPVTCRSCVEKVITELGVIEVSDLGLVLTEVAPRVATDEVKIRTGARLHIADDIRVMELWD